jgi:tRNA (guanine37-N1)-methyltransferase
MRIDIVTLFPGIFEGFLRESIIKIAQERRLVQINLFNLRDFTPHKHKKVDAPPYGGGPGMVIRPEPVFSCVEFLRSNGREDSCLVLLTPTGTPYTQSMAKRLSEEKGMILLCGHYEGFDERVSLGLKPLEISIGDYVLTGGELPAMVIIDSVIRLIPGVLGDSYSTQEESFTEGRLEYPHYTRPRSFRGMQVPPVLLSGDHRKIRQWRQEESLRRTTARRPDLKGSTS